MRRRQRVDPWGPWQAFTGAFVLAGAVMVSVLVVAAVRAAARGIDMATGAGFLAATAVMAAWLTFAVRLYLIGIYRDDRGLLLRHVHRSRLLPWSEVTGFEVRAARMPGGTTVRAAIWVRTRDDLWEAPVQQRSMRPGWRKNNGPVLSEAAFRLTLERLRAAHTAAQYGATGGVVVR
ncbi:hypothetical protein ACH495_25030 [Micromonospora sp. NPDC018662]|uniref:hypothetical protein n=1 Tax=Micromonospora sp. NPDC018662 TaxID=3364238 RepID=UPI0037AB4541